MEIDVPIMFWLQIEEKGMSRMQCEMHAQLSCKLQHSHFISLSVTRIRNEKRRLDDYTRAYHRDRTASLVFTTVCSYTALFSFI